jgi:hypothetical protein
LRELAQEAGLEAVVTTLKDARNHLIEQSKIATTPGGAVAAEPAKPVEVETEFQRN